MNAATSAATTTTPKTRTARTTADQYMMYVEELENNFTFRTGKSKSGHGPQIIESTWTKLTNTLNSSGLGPIRGKEGWKKVFLYEYLITLTNIGTF